jgi:hypothetical protein
MGTVYDRNRHEHSAEVEEIGVVYDVFLSRFIEDGFREMCIIPNTIISLSFIL